MSKIILHCDLDSFFASVEQRDHPEYRGKPVIIGADPKEGKGRGVASTCSYEARKYGIHSAMPISQAYKRCPHGNYIKPTLTKYREASERVMEILQGYSKIFQQVGIDEAYLDISDVCGDFNEARKLCEKIKQEVFDKVGITISIGCAPTKSIAKIASDHNKPNGVTVVKPEYIKKFLDPMDITRIPGIGKKSKIYYYRKGIKKIGDIINTPLHRMMELFGKNGKWIWKISNGIDKREVKDFPYDRKSISAERTFYTDSDDFNVIISKLEEINERIHKTLEKSNTFYRTISLKIRFEGFETYLRSKSLNFPIRNKAKTLQVVLDLYKEFSNKKKKVRLVGIKFSNLEKDPKTKQANLLSYIDA